MFGFTVLAFLIVCAILAIATYLVFNSGEQGKTKLGGCAGCAVGFALLAIAGFAAAICAFVMLVTTKSELVRHGPIKSIELELGDHDDADAKGGAKGSNDRDASSEAGDLESQKPGAAGPTDRSSGVLRPVIEGSSEKQQMVHLKLVIRGKDYPASISEWMRENTQGDVSVTITTQGDRTIVDYGFPISREDLKKLRRDFKQALPGMQLPKGVKVEIKDADD
jgi:hypothetical protein